MFLAVGLYRLFGAAYLVMFVVYFSFRAVYSIGERDIPWRVFVLFIEFLASMSVCFVVILKLKRPWTSWVAQPDGTQIPRNWKTEDNKSPSKEKSPSLTTVTEKSESEVSPRDTAAAAKTKDVSMSEESVVVSKKPGTAPAAEELSPEVMKRVIAPSAADVKVDENSVDPTSYVVRVLVPCYKEDLSIIKDTIEAALKMHHNPENLFVYLCDDGNDPAKAAFIEELNFKGFHNAVYVTRPAAFKGHGKAGNLNYCLRHVIYKHAIEEAKAKAKLGDGSSKKPVVNITRKELVSIFDADMVAAPHYLNRLIPYFVENPAVVMVQSPQTFHNVPMSADFFDAHNVNFFGYMLPAMSAWNTTTCCGTNFVVSAKALSRAGWFPYISVTEDMHLAIKMLETGGIIRYHAENLAIGEAPEDIRQIFQQRSRWAKGTIQIMLKDNPLHNHRLNWIQRLSFFNACWSYITSATMNPLFVVINGIGICFGMFPVNEIKFATAMLFVCYYSLFYCMIHFTPVPTMHYIPLWIVGKMGHFFSFMALKAIVNVIKAESSGQKSITFKVTKKSGGQGGNAPLPTMALAVPDEKDLKQIERLKRKKAEAAEAERRKLEALTAQGEEAKTEDGTTAPADGAAADADLDKSVSVNSPKGAEADKLAAAEEENERDVHKEFEDENPAIEPRDSSYRDVRFHIVICTLILFIIFYGFWVVLGMPRFLPEHKDERSAYQKQGIRLFCVCWMVQFFIAYSLPIWYAVLPRSFYAQGIALKVLAFIDTLLSVSLIVVTVLLFQFDWFRSTPDIKKITDFFPAKNSLWMYDSTSVSKLEDYIYDRANDLKIPVVVMYKRPFRDAGGFSEGGVGSFGEYRTMLNDVAGKLAWIDFPVMMVMEPDWMMETVNAVSEDDVGRKTDEGYTYLTETVDIVNEDGTVTEDAVVNIEFFESRFKTFVELFNDFASKLPPMSQLYIDAGHPKYLAQTGFVGLKYLKKQLSTASPVRGISLNTANFYSDANILKVAAEAYSKYGFRWVSDVSRNGGFFSNSSTWAELDACRFDPPGMDVGTDPVWADFAEDETVDLLAAGCDAKLWIKVPGESDGRMFAAGDYHKCLFNHNIPCDSTCPEVPVTISPSCQCKDDEL